MMDQGFAGLYKDLVFGLKKNRIIRGFTWPYITAKRSLNTCCYVHSDQSRRIMKWKDACKGRRCFVIGNGPSLNAGDLDILRENSEITFSSNRIYHIYDKTTWRPDFYVAFEPEFCRTNAVMISALPVRSARFINMAAYSSKLESESNYWLNCTMKYTLNKLSTDNIEFSDNISVCVYDAYSVTYTILQLAIYMGFKEIYMLGVDHYGRDDADSRHFYKNMKNEYQTPTYIEGIEYGYMLARKEAKKRGISIYNATRGGSLEIFERVRFDSLF